MKIDLVATCWTHAGVSQSLNGQVVSTLDIGDRVREAARAGFVGIGFTIEDLMAARADISWPDLKILCDDLGVTHTEVELLTDWWTEGGRRARSDEKRTLLLEAATALRARQIKIAADTTADREPIQPARWATELHALAAQAQDAGTRVALEVLPMSNIADFTQASALISAADHPAAGLCVDIWHLERGPSALDDLAAIPGPQVFCVELNDAPAEQVGDLLYDTTHHRKLCGDGSFDVKGFIATLLRLGFPGPWGVEIISTEHQARPLRQSLPEVYRTTIAQFERR